MAIERPAASDEATPDSPTVRSVERTLDLLEAVVVNGGESSAGRLSEQLELSPATTYRLLTLLDRRGYLRHVRARRTYTIGPQALVIGEVARQFLGSWSEPVLADLASQTGETANLAVLEHHGAVYVAQVRSPDQRVRSFAGVGQLVPAHSTGVGKVMLAFSPDTVRDELLKRTGLAARTQQTFTNRAEFLDHLREIREQGYAVDDEEEEEGVRCIAVPVFLRGEVRAAVSVSAPRGRAQDPSTAGRIEPLRTAAARLMEILEIRATRSRAV